MNATVIGRVALRGDDRHPSPRGAGALGDLRSLARVIAAHGVERVIIVPASHDQEEILHAIRLVKALGVKVSVLPRLLEVVGSSSTFDDVDGITLLAVRHYGLSMSSEFLKRLMDIVAATIGLALLAPLLLLLAIAVKVDSSSGPVFFRQPRIGRRGERFNMLKFRSMVPDAEQNKSQLRERNEAEGGLFKIRDDPRITRVGRFMRRSSLDELPQLLNVLKGNMSLVGPRPLVPDEDALIEGWERRRLAVKPGMTGLWQILRIRADPDAGHGEDRLPLRGELVALAGRQDPAAHGPLHARAEGPVNASATRGRPLAIDRAATREHITSNGAVGLVHDYLLVMRGAERTFATIAECIPNAPIYTLLYDPDTVRARFRGRAVRASSLQRLPVGQESFRALLPLLPHAAEHLPVTDHDLVVSSSSAFAHGVRHRDDALHISYCHTPCRYAWHARSVAEAEVSAPLRPALRRVLDRVRRWDLEASRRVSHYIANSEVCRQRIGEAWGRDASVVYPPVETERFRIGQPEDFFLVVTELVPHKHVDAALEAARRAQHRVKVVGGGPEWERLRVQYANTAEFLGRVSDTELEDLYPRARALLVPNIEEFGIAAVEAQAAGRPVVAYDAGGTRETVVDGTTGVLVPPGDVSAMAEAMRHTNFDAFSPHRIKRHADRFSASAFRSRFVSELCRLVGEGRRVGTACD